MPANIVTLIARAAVDIERGLRLPAGPYPAIEKWAELRSHDTGVSRGPSRYWIEFTPEQITRFGGKVAHFELISDQYDVTEQVRAGTLLTRGT
jgi:hypothetical protein